MIDLQQVQAELNCARRARIAAEEAAGCEIEALVLDMQNHAWSESPIAASSTQPTTRICSGAPH